jgi:hypothetical protein
MANSWKHCAKVNEVSHEGFCLYEVSKIGKPIYTESKLVVFEG